MPDDQIDLLLGQWRRERPDFDASPMGILGRLSILNRNLNEDVEAILKQHDLSFPEFDMLAVLRRFGPPFRQRVSDLCEHSFLSSGAMTNRVDRLERKGLIRREPNPEDRRGVLVVLTKKGRTLIDRVVAQRLEVGKSQVSVLSKKDQQQLATLLKRFMASLMKEDA
ncbi:MarR family transcriptional regulator [Planctomycetota bacterium]|nr:MarR family transcriptional regulator [Planctomycetota bacterium]